MQTRPTVLITGATKGIGQAIAIELAATGYDLLLVARHVADLEALSTVIKQRHPASNVHFFPCDLSEATGCGQLLEWLAPYEVSVLVNNVGVYHPVSVLEETEEDFVRQWQVNYVVPHRLSRAMALKMVEHKDGHIINITSVVAENPVAVAGTYSVTKAALRSLTHVLREELRLHGIRVTEIVPGATKTASWSGTTIPDSRFVMPEDIARAVGMALQMSDGASMDEVVVTPRLGNS